LAERLRRRPCACLADGRDSEWKRDEPTEIDATCADPKSGRRSHGAAILAAARFTAQGCAEVCGCPWSVARYEVPRKLPPATPYGATFGHLLGTPTAMYTRRQWTNAAHVSDHRFAQD
jgi:hypothetical protein